MNISPTIRRKLKRVFSRAALVNSRVPVGTFVVAFYGKQLYYGCVVLSFDTRQRHKDIQWLIPIGDKPYAQSTAFRKHSYMGLNVCNFVRFKDFYVIQMDNYSNNYVTVSPNQLVQALLHKQKRGITMLIRAAILVK
jgi:hypothetical protein